MQTVKFIGEGFGVFILVVGVILLYGYAMWLLSAKLDGEFRTEFNKNKKQIRETLLSIRNILQNKINVVIKYPSRLKF